MQRKGIEHAINLVKALDLPQCKLVISHEAGDEGYEYATWLTEYAQSQQVDMLFVDCPLADPWGTATRCYPQFSLEEVYPAADFVTYPSISEGFGNGFLEAIYFHKPLLVNRYATYVRDIEPHGFDVVSIDGFLNSPAVEQVRQLIQSPKHREQATAHNYAIAKRHFSYETLENQINTAMAELFSNDFNRLGAATGSADTIIPLPGTTDKELRDSVPWAKKYN